MKDILEKKIEYTENFLSGYSSNDLFISSSLNHETVLTLSFLEWAGFKCNVYYVNSGLIDGDWQKNADIVSDKFDHNLVILDATHKKEELLADRPFFSIDETERQTICQSLKKETLFESISSKNYQIWITGIRKAETKSRQSMKAISLSNGYIKFSPIFHLSDEEVYFMMRYHNLNFLSELLDNCKSNKDNECGLHL